MTLDNQIQAWLASLSKTGSSPLDYTIVDHSDGFGPQIGSWNSTTLGTQPTVQQLASVASQAQVLATVDLMKQGEAAITAWLDSTAAAYGYDNILSACSYQLSSVDLYKRQSTALASWRDAVWQAAEQQQASVQAGTEQPPTSVAALIAALPQPNVPAT